MGNRWVIIKEIQLVVVCTRILFYEREFCLNIKCIIS